MCSCPRRLPKERLLDNLNDGCLAVVMEKERWPLPLPPLRMRVGTKGEEHGIFMSVGERVSATYWGPDASRDEGRIADDDEGPCR
jgi:hypothetical protein